MQMNFDASTITSYLDGMIAIKQKMMKPEEFQYWGQEDFVKQYGQAFGDKVHQPVYARRSTPKECYANATHLAMEDSNLIYCEGYILRVIPIPHAWCVDYDGVVFDPTIQDNKGCEYFGVPFSTEFLFKMMAIETKKHYGLLDDPEQRFPLLRGKYQPDEFLEHLNSYD